MPENYFELSRPEQAELLQDLSPAIDRRAEILEKDIWLCQILDILFKLACRKPMAFKGGTSLSKVYQAIDRFSEDIDVTIDYLSLLEDAPDLAVINNSQRKKLSDQLKLRLSEHITRELVPALEKALSEAMPDHQLSLKTSEDAEKLWIYYPSVVDNSSTYLQSSILIEFGGRNSALPQQTMTITPDVEKYVPAIAWPKAQVAVLSPARTFWEKATLIHVECHRPQVRLGAERLSRHWYDLARLANHAIGNQAIKDMTLLKDVLQIKETFFRSGNSNYERCLSGELRLIPDADLTLALRQDYQKMLDAQMFYGERLPFDDIVDRLKLLEIEINQAVTQNQNNSLKES